MATDARGHNVPASTDRPRRQNLLDLSSSIRDVSVVANTTARTALVSAMTTAGLTPSTSNPLFLFRTDSLTFEVTTDGTNFSVIPARLAQTYAVGWTASTTNPSIGNGTLVGNFTVDDQFVDFDITLTIGSTTALGTGSFYFLTLPVTPAAGRKMFDGNFFDASVPQEISIKARANGTTALTLFQNAGALTSVFSPTTPVIPATGDVYHIASRYKHS